MVPYQSSMPSQRVRVRPRYLLPLLALIPSLLAVLQLGRIHPDEVYQTLEPAFWKSNGYGILAWEWHEGLRNWVIPGLFAWILKLTRAIGLEHPQAYRAALEAPQFLLHCWALFAVFRYARRRGSEAQAIWATAVVALWGLTLTFAGRTLGESFSTSMMVIGLELLDRPPARMKDALAGLWVALSVVARYGSLVFAAAVILWLLVRRQWVRAARVLAGAALAAALLGLVDFVTWGAPFHSFIHYVRFNLVSGASAETFGKAPWYFYLPGSLSSSPYGVGRGCI